jgi:peptide/nickel transport system permease protein
VSVTELPGKRSWIEAAVSQRRRLPRNTAATIGIGVLAVMVLAAVLAPWVAPYDPNVPHVTDRLATPSGEYLLGTDLQGRDILSRIIWGARPSLIMAFASLGIAGAIGLLLGVVAGYVGGVLDGLIMRTVDVFFGLPPVLLGILVALSLGPGLWSVVAALVIVMIPPMTRVSYQGALSVRSKPYIDAARLSGARSPRILVQHVVPNIFAPVAAYGASLAGAMIVFGAGLSFVGVGIQPPQSDWGSMINEGRVVIFNAPHVATLPGLAIVLTSLAFNLVSDAFRDAMDPRLSV